MTLQDDNKSDSNPTVEDSSVMPKESIILQIFSIRMGVCMVTGFASGMPLFVFINLFSAFLSASNVSLKTIGVMSLMMMPYTWKFLWAPLLDRYSFLHFSRRKGWIILSQAILIAAIASMGFVNPLEDMWLLTILAFILTFASATQDIVLDAFRREYLREHEFGLGNSIFVNAYRVAGLIPGGVALVMAQYMDWWIVFTFTAACLSPCLVLSFFLKENQTLRAPRTLKAAVVEPFVEFISRRGIQAAIFIVFFVFLYKIGDSMALALATPFYMDIGYDLATIGIITKSVGLWATIVGGLMGGIFMLKLGINRALWVFGAIQVVTILGFYQLAVIGESEVPPVWILSVVLIGEFGGSGLGTAAFTAFIAKETNPAYTATQLALLTSCSAVPRTFCNATSGYLVDSMGWANFFLFCTAIAIPGMLLLFKVAPFRGEKGVS